ncbi:MAG TPA: response regulator [Woeseiaceae bacterium]|nr:response regulator [Woeseiaceae bacterium]
MHTGPHILVVDDDPEIRELLGSYLEDMGFRASIAENAVAARAAVARDAPDLVVLDLMLPGESGLDFCRELRKRSALPVIMLTALGDTVDRIVGLEVGADDYLVKPFDPRELVSRIRSVLRRAPGAAQPADVTAWRFGGWRLDRVSRTLTRDAAGAGAARIELSGAEFRVLELLLERPGQVLTRATLTEVLRGRGHDPFDRSIDVRISKLRQLLDDDARAPTIIKTVYGEGYALGVPVAAE